MRAYLAILFGLLVVVLAGAQDKPAPKKDKGGLKPGEEVPGVCQPYNINGKFKGRFHCLVCEHGLNPVAAVFVRGTDNTEGVAALLQALEAAVKTKQNEKAGLAAFAVFEDDQLADVVGNDDKREELTKKLEDTAAKLDRVAVALESKSNLEKFRLDPDADVTILLYDKLKVVEVKPLAKSKLTKEGVPALVKDIVAKLVKK